jgi:hypothetical protein
LHGSRGPGCMRCVEFCWSHFRARGPVTNGRVLTPVPDVTDRGPGAAIRTVVAEGARRVERPRLSAEEHVRRLVDAAPPLSREQRGTGSQSSCAVATPVLRTPLRPPASGKRPDRCGIPRNQAPKWCHVHHIWHWADGGPTSCANAVLVCGHHHRVIHHHGWDVHIQPDGLPSFYPPAWIDPDRAPRRNHRHTPHPPPSHGQRHAGPPRVIPIRRT